MKRPDIIPLEDFTYILPEERIAKFPLSERDHSKLLVYRKGSISETTFNELPGLLCVDQLLVFNDTRVIHARIRFRKSSGARIEVFCLEPLEPPGHQLSFDATGSTKWKCLVGNSRKWKEGEVLECEFFRGEILVVFQAEKGIQVGNAFHINFRWTPSDLTFSEIIDAAGETPIPPYLKREAVPEDSETYQTVYSEREGSVAAPTAGLHFTQELLNTIERKGISRLSLTLHVGAGTFIPVKTENAAEHRMHVEKFIVTKEAIDQLMSHGKEILATGTTSCRTLESLYWLGVKVINGVKGRDLQLGQWEAWDLPQDVKAGDALRALSELTDKEKEHILQASTGIMITPGYKFRMVTGLITNFHQPSSTLLMLIAAFIGNDWKKVYQYALDHNFRFLSYGDSSLLLP